MDDFALTEPDLKIIELDSKYSTTRCLSKVEPELEDSHAVKIKSRLFFSTQNPGMIHGGLRCSGYFKYTLPGRILITVITVVYNGEKHLEQTIQSIINQTYTNIEYIIIDGGSTDKSLDIIHQYEDKIDYWLSEPDQGIADAMNKGIRHANGEYLIFIHADDYLLKNDVISNAMWLASNETEVILCGILYGKKLIKLVPRGFNFWLNFRNGVPHQGAICKTALFKKIGYFDLRFKVVMDYDFFMRIYRHGVKSEKLPLVLSVMRDGGISSKKNWPDLLYRLNEEKAIHEKHTNSYLLLICYKIFWSLYTPYKWILSKK